MSVTCARKFSRYAVCGAVLEMTTVEGRLVVTCPACARFLAGICHDCPLPVDGVVGKARRCAVHKRAQEKAERTRYRARNHAKHNERSKLYMRQPDVRARNIANVKAWRLAHPDKVRAQRKLHEFRGYLALRRTA